MSRNDGGAVDPCYVFYDAVRNTDRLSQENIDWILGMFYMVECKVKSLQTQNSDLRQKLLNERVKIFPIYEINALRKSASLLNELADFAERSRET